MLFYVHNLSTNQCETCIEFTDYPYNGLQPIFLLSKKLICAFCQKFTLIDINTFLFENIDFTITKFSLIKLENDILLGGGCHGKAQFYNVKKRSTELAFEIKTTRNNNLLIRINDYLFASCNDGKSIKIWNYCLDAIYTVFGFKN